MTFIQIVNTILVLSLPPLVALCYVFAQLFIQRLPTAQRTALEQFARQAVQYVEYQQIKSDKKPIATVYLTDMFRLSGLPVPHEDVLEVAIGSAFYEIEKEHE
jgi:hypothetical protein